MSKIVSKLTEAFQPTTGQHRLQGLDGIRGIAIILVILNHIPLSVLYAKTPAIIHPIFVLLLANGKTGVSLLFMLSGFLMAWLYAQPKSVTDFLGKRYLRIFPPLLVMVTALSIIRNWPLKPLYISAVTPVVMAILGYCAWQVGIKAHQKFGGGRFLLYAMLAVQTAVGLWYVFYLQNISPQVYYANWSEFSQAVVTFLVNGTLTLPLGRYVGQLDGVYWSLITELAFYLLYPTLLVPIVSVIEQRVPRWGQVLMFATSLPFFFGLSLLSQRVLGFGMMQLHFFVYFIVGIVIAKILRGREETLMTQLNGRFAFLKSWAAVPVMLFLIICSVIFYTWVPHFYHPWVHLVWSIVLGGVMLLSILPTKWGQFLSRRGLVAFGTYSSSLYVLHSLVVEMLTQGKEPQTILAAVTLIVGVFVVSAFYAKIFYWLVERPYFTVRKVKTETKKLEPKLAAPTSSPKKTLAVFVFFSAVLCVSFFVAYRSPNAFFTREVKHREQASLADQSEVAVTETPLRVRFTGAEDNMGIITTSLKTAEVKDKQNIVHTGGAGILQMRLLDEKDAQLASSTFEVHQLGESRFHPFGFPLVADAKDKTFTVEYQILKPDLARKVILIHGEAQLQTVYFLNKKELIKNPPQLIKHVITKVTQPFQEKVALKTMAWMAPLMLLLSFALLYAVRREPSPTTA